jgi:hypothetical protein
VSVSDGILPSISTMGLATLIFSNAMAEVTAQLATVGQMRGTGGGGDK